MKKRWLAVAVAVASAVLAAGCSNLALAPSASPAHAAPEEHPDPPAVSTPAPQQDLSRTPWAARSALPGEAWVHQAFPGKKPTRFQYARKDGRDAVAVTAASSASMVRRELRIEPEALGRMRFSWIVPQLVAGADLGSRDADDSPVRVVLAFDGDRSRLSPRDAMLSELARTLTGEEMPYATLMYVWCNQRAAGSVVHSPRTGRIRKLVLESGEARLNRWLDYERDIRADYERAFGEPPGALIGVAIMTDTDNTRTSTRAWYGPLQLLAGRTPGARP